MRIAFISLMGGQPWGGSEVLWYKTALLALQQGHEVLTSIYNWGNKNVFQINELKRQGANIHLRNKWDVNESIIKKINRRLAKKWNYFTEDWRELIKFKPDKVFISQGGNFDMAMHHQELYHVLLNCKTKYSIVCHSHQQFSFFPDKKWYPAAKEIFLNAEHVFFVSHRQWNLTERMICTKLKNAHFTWNPLNLKKFDYIKWPDINPLKMAIVGALNSGKGHDTLFEVLSNEIWKQRNWQLNIYGKGEGENYLKDLCKFYQLEDKVQFKGFVSSATEIWENNHILLIPSSGEGLPISLVEAAICGRPAVVTDVGGNTEIIEEGKTGFVACAPTVDSFSETLEKSWQNRSEWENIGLILKNHIDRILNRNPENIILNKLLNSDD